MSDATEARLLSDESLVGQIADEFTERLQRGERPDVEEYAQQHPRVAGLLRQVLPALQVMAGPEPAAPGGPVACPDVVPGCLGDFRIVREIGRGGMGVVYEAVQLSLNRRVALKVLPFASGLDVRHQQRFKNEAQAAAHLHHNHVVPVYGVGCDRGVHYYAMQYIEGESLATLVRELREAAGLQETSSFATGPSAGGLYSGGQGPAERGPAGFPVHPEAPPAAAPAGDTVRQVATTLVAPGSGTCAAYFHSVARLGVQAAEALEYAHGQGVVHRDIKPANLLVDLHGHLWVTDFGLARLQGGDGGLTMTGDVVGTLRYMSPEQALARRCAIDHRTDVYSLGVTLYELLTLRPAHPGRDREALLRQVAFEEPVPPRRVNRAVPRELETIVLKAMAKSPEERYASAGELGDDLQRFLEDRPIQARRPTTLQRVGKFVRRHRAVLNAVVFSALLVLVGCFVFIYRSYQAEKAAREDEARQRSRAESALCLALHTLDIHNHLTHKWFTRDPRRSVDDENLLVKTLNFYNEFLKANRDSPACASEAEIAIAYERSADIEYRLGRYPQAEHSYHRAIQHLEALAAGSADGDMYRLEQARCFDRLGVVLVSQNHLPEAEQVHWKALPILLRLHLADKDDPEREQALAFCYHALGRVQEDLGRSTEAVESYQKALNHQEHLALKPQDNYLHDLAWTRSALAGLLWHGGNVGDAEKAYRKAEKEFETLAHSFEDPFYKVRLAQILDQEGTFFLATGRPNLAGEAFLRSAREMDWLVDKYRTVPLYQLDQAMGKVHLSEAYLLTGRVSEVRRLLAGAVESLERLDSAQPPSPEYKMALAEAYYKSGNLSLARRDFTNAEAFYAKTLDLGNELCQLDPGNALHHELQATANQSLATILRETGRPREAREALDRAAKVYENLAHTFPDTSEYRNKLASCRISVGLVLARYDPQEAERALRDGLQVELDLAEKNPHVPGYQDWVGRTEAELAQLLLRTDRCKEGSEAQRRALDRFENLHAAYPGVPEYGETVIELRDGWGQALEKAGRSREAAKAYRQALAAAGNLPAAAGHALERRRLTATAQVHLAWLLATHPDPCCRDPAEALRLARGAVRALPQDGMAWSARGAAYLGAGEWARARDDLVKGRKLRRGGDGSEEALLAIACWRLGEGDEAMRWYEQAARRNDPGDGERQRLRAEAADVLGLAAPPVPCP